MNKRLPLLLSSLFLSGPDALACITCNQQVRRGIAESAAGGRLLALLLPFLVLGVVVALLARAAGRQAPVSRQADGAATNAMPFLVAALVLGMGLGGFVDGIVLHQVLQWHEMLSAKVPPVTLVAKSVNMFWDGVFHLFCLLVVLTGVVLLWRAARGGGCLPGRLLAGGLLGGWGLFNLLEGLMDHHLLQLHHVREQSGSVAAWDWGFILFSVVLLAGAWGLVRRAL